ncbi:MAG: ABC transporter ATP-binding protein [Candidatus Heimdallarchaeota archaeon]|nr:ABC transporter ATP-binding protein [Candidatus Heimdallarchaeota archaeon]
MNLHPSNSNYLQRKYFTRHPLVFLLHLLWQRKFLFFYIILGIITHQSLRFVTAPLTGNLVELGIEKQDYNAVAFYAWMLLIVTFVSAFFDLTMSWANEIGANDVEYHVRDIYFQSVQEKSQSFHDSAKVGEMMAIAQNDLRSLYSAMAPGIRIMGESFVSLVTIAVIIFLESTLLGFVFLILLPFWLWALKIYGNRLAPVAVKQQSDFRDLSAEVQENLAAAEVVRAFSQEHKETENFKKYNQQYTDSWEQRGKITALYFPMLATYATGGILFLLGSYMVLNPVITIFGYSITHTFGLGGLVTLIVLIIQLRGPAMQINFVLEFWTLGLAGVRKVQEVLLIEERLPISETPVRQAIKGQVEFRDVSFSYNGGKQILEHISFKVTPGDIVAIVGSTGSGKSSLLKLITRLYDPTEGAILIDNIDVREFDPEVLNESIGVVEQDVFLFSSSVRENIVFARDEYTEEELEAVIKQARINEFVHELPNDIDTIVGERGVRLSGGQKQRVAIARALLVDPKILILDDSTSAVDAKTEQEIVEALKELMKGRTTFIITNRLNMIRQASKVLVLEDGKITGEGLHTDLIKQNKVYRRIFDPHLELPPMEEMK